MAKITLTELVNQTNTVFELKLDQSAQQEIVAKLRLTDTPSHVSTKEINGVLNRILTMAKTKSSFSNRYANNKRVVEAAVDTSVLKCPKCTNRMIPVELINNRKAMYCTTDRITLPVKV